MNPPILLFVYNRYDHAKKTLESILSNPNVSHYELIVFSDGPKSEADFRAVSQVRSLFRSVQAFKSLTLVTRDENYGLSKSIVSGVTDCLSQWESCIVLEDDLLISPCFLSFMSDGLNKYCNVQEVGSIHGYVYPTKRVLPTNFLMKGADCWGWATWKRAWDLFEADGSKLLQALKDEHLIDEFDFGGAYSYSGLLKKQVEGEVDSWAIRWHASLFLKNMLTLYPGKSLVQNIGNDRSGTHCGNYSFLDVGIEKEPVPVVDIEVVPSAIGYSAFADFFSSNKQTKFAKSLRMISSFFKN